MIIVLSPSKTLADNVTLNQTKYTKPILLKESKKLIESLKKCSLQELEKLMSISTKLATLNLERFQNFTTPFNKKNSTPALYTFKGDVYDGLKANTFDQKDEEFAQNHLRILSGLYGLLKPLDLMQPYRLEIGLHYKTEKRKNLYEFWGDLINKSLNKQLAEQKKPVLVNLASNEYFKAVHKHQIDFPIITPFFKDKSKGTYKVISFYAKKARGMMANFAIKNKIKRVEQLKDFTGGDYEYNASISDDRHWGFCRG